MQLHSRGLSARASEAVAIKRLEVGPQRWLSLKRAQLEPQRQLHLRGPRWPEANALKSAKPEPHTPLLKGQRWGPGRVTVDAMSRDARVHAHAFFTSLIRNTTFTLG